MTTELRPQPGFQERFLASPADIVIGGGSAGCGKTYSAILAGARHYQVPGFSAVFFRRNLTQVKNPGGLWDEASRVYPLLGAKPNNVELEWRWATGSKVKMAHLEHEDTVKAWDGSQVPLFAFDELTHFSALMFWFFLSRNRSTCGVRSQIIATCNPDADSWVAELLAWWIEQDEASPNYGFPIAARAGRLRYFTRTEDQIIWGNTRREVMAQAPGMEAVDVRSLTFIPGRLEENKLGDPRYRGQLMALSRVMRARLLDGNWKVRAATGEVFRRHEVTMLDEVPGDVTHWVRRWDLAATEPSEGNRDPDWTAGVLMGRRKGGRYVVADCILERKRADEVRKLVLRTAGNDGKAVKVVIPQDPGQAGVDQVRGYTSMLAGFAVSSDRETGDKVTRAEPLAAQWQGGNVDVVRGPWNAAYFGQMEGFPAKGIHDDAVDASSGAFARLVRGRTMFDVL